MLSGGMAAGAPSPGHEPRLHSLCPTSVALPLSGPQPRPHSWPILPFASLPGLLALPASQEHPPHRCPGPHFALSKAVPLRESFRYVRSTGYLPGLPARLVGALQLHPGRAVLGLSAKCMPDGECQRRALGLRSVASRGGSLGHRRTHRWQGPAHGPAGGRASSITGKLRAQTGRALAGRRIWKNWKRQSYKYKSDFEGSSSTTWGNEIFKAALVTVYP